MGIKMNFYEKLSTGRILLLILLFFSICLGSYIATADFGESTTINLDSYIIEVGSNVTVPIEITNATEVAGGFANISFNPAIVNVEEVLRGDFSQTVPNFNNTVGWISIACSNGFTPIGIDNATLASVRFKGISKGFTTLNFTNAYLSDETGYNISYPETFNGTINVNGCCVGTTQNFTCGDEVTESCTFDGCMSCPEGHGLIIGADNIVIDGNNYTLDGVSSGACDSWGTNPTGIYNKAHDDIVIKNIEIKNFCNGIYFKYDEGGSGEEIKVENITIDNCEIHHNGGDSGGDNSVHGIKLIGVFDSVIRNCEVHDNIGKGDSCEGGGNGIFLKGISGYGAWNNTITENEIYDNKKGGFFTKMMCTDTEVSYNELWGNGQGGIILRCMKSETHDIHDNNASYNFGSGIFIGGPDNTIGYNIASYNKNGSEYSGGGAGPGSGSPGKYGMGICMGRSDGSFNNEIISNEVCGNEGVDIEVCPACEGNTGDDNTCDTTFNYDDEGTTGCTYSCAPCVLFDTGSGTYPSIRGTHNGTIKLNHTITVHRMYTYPCFKTDGHSEFVAFYNSTTGAQIANGTWIGTYLGNYQWITFDTPFTLEAGKTYNYTLITGCYPQIIHKQTHTTAHGTITCTRFVDPNGRVYHDWIPAIKLWGGA